MFKYDSFFFRGKACWKFAQKGHKYLKWSQRIKVLLIHTWKNQHYNKQINVNFMWQNENIAKNPHTHIFTFEIRTMVFDGEFLRGFCCMHSLVWRFLYIGYVTRNILRTLIFIHTNWIQIGWSHVTFTMECLISWPIINNKKGTQLHGLFSGNLEAQVNWTSFNFNRIHYFNANRSALTKRWNTPKTAQLTAIFWTDTRNCNPILNWFTPCTACFCVHVLYCKQLIFAHA